MQEIKCVARKLQVNEAKSKDPQNYMKTGLLMHTKSVQHSTSGFSKGRFAKRLCQQETQLNTFRMKL
jgi:hypothetical protein